MENRIIARKRGKRMTKEAKAIIKKDIKKYESLANVTQGENKEVYAKVAIALQEIIEE